MVIKTLTAYSQMVTVTKTYNTKEAFLLILKNTKRKIHKVPAHLRERASGMLQGGMRTADVARPKMAMSVL
jgi:ABC-type proline/glycine betaine transport system permease subunit